MRHRHRGLSTYGLNGQRQGDEHLRIMCLRGVAPFTFTLPGCPGKWSLNEFCCCCCSVKLNNFIFSFRFNHMNVTAHLLQVSTQLLTGNRRGESVELTRLVNSAVDRVDEQRVKAAVTWIGAAP